MAQKLVPGYASRTPVNDCHVGARGMAVSAENFLLCPTATQLWSPGGVESDLSQGLLRTR